MKASKVTHPVRLAKRKLEKKLLTAKDSKIECLEGRIAPATVYVNTLSNLSAHITTDNGAPGLDAGDVVTWDPGAGSVLGGAVTGLVYGTDVFSSIQSAVDYATTISVGHDDILVGAGTYSESLTIGTDVSLFGSGSGNNPATTDTIIQAGAANTAVMVFTASGQDATHHLMISDVRVTGATGSGNNGAGIRLENDASFLTLDHVTVTGNAGYGVAIDSTGAVQDIEVLNSELSNNLTGFRVPTSLVSLDGLTISGTQFIGNTIGLEVNATTGHTGLTNVAITDTDFTGNTQKGAYFERLDHATFTDITVSNNGTSPTAPAGIDINLKYASYSDISFTGATFTDNGSGSATGAGLTIKARNDNAGSPNYAANPASLTALTLTNVSISGSPGDLSLGNNVDLGTVALSGVSLGGTGAGLVLFGNTPGQTLAAGNTSFDAALAAYVVNQSTGTSINATAATFDGLTGATATLAQNFAIEDKITHRVDDPSYGFVLVKTGNVFVTGNSFHSPATTTASVQRGVDAATTGDTLHIQAGTYTGSVTTTGKAITFSPGSSPGQVTLTGDLALDSNDTLAIEIDGTNPATQFDNFVVTGNVALGGATLSLTGSHTPVTGNSFTIISATGTVSGTLAGEPVGSTVLFNSQPLAVNYNSSSFVLSFDATPTIEGTAGADDFTISADGSGNLVVKRGGVTVSSTPLSSLTSLTLNGGDGDDTFTIDYGALGGFFNLPIFVNGGNQGGSGDSLIINDAPGTATTVTHTFANANDGSVNIDGNLITYTGLEPITDNLDAANRVFDFTGGTENITLVDAGGGMMTIDSDLAESVTFTSPTTSLTIHAGTGDDTVTITSMDAAYHGALTIDGGGNNDSLTLGAGLPSLAALTITTASIAALPGLTIGAGGLSLTSTSSDLTQTGPLVVSGATVFDIGATHNLTLNDAGNDFSSVGITSGHNISLTDTNALVLAASTVSGTLGVTTSGTITQSGALSVTGAATLAAGAANNITLNDAGNNFSSVGIASGNNVLLTDLNALVLAASTISGTLGVTTSGAITQSGALSVTGAATLAAGAANDITLTNPSDDFSSVTLTSVRNASLKDVNALTLNASTVSGNLITDSTSLTIGGAVSVTGDATLSMDTFTASATLTAGAAKTAKLLPHTVGLGITLGGTIGGTLSLTDAALDNVVAGTVQIGDATVGAINVAGAITHTNNLSLVTGAGVSGAGALGLSAGKNLSITANGAVNLTGAVTVSGTTTVAAGAANNVTLSNAANDFGTLSISSGNNVSVTDVNALILGAAAIAGTFGVTTNGAITQSGALVVTGATTLAAGAANDITLNSAANDFSTLGVTSGNNVSVADTNALNLGASTVSGTLGVTTNGAITQSGALVVTGTTTLAAGAANNITLNNAGNNFSTFVVTSGNNVSVADANALNLGASTMSGTLGVTTSGAITQSGALVVTGATTLAAGAANNITLNNAGNNFSTFAVTSGNNVSVTDTNALDLGASTVSGTLGVTTSGAITQSGAVVVTGTTTLAAGAAGNITLNNAGNNFSTFVVTSGNNVSVTDTNALDLGASTVSGTLGVTANGAITQSGALVVTGATTLAAGAANNVTLNNAANNFSSVGITSGNAVSLVDVNTITLSASTVSGALTVTANALTVSGALGVTGAVNFNADAMTIGAGVTTPGTVSLLPRTAGVAINLGGADAGGVLGLTDAELGFISAGVIQVGNASTGTMTVSAPIDLTDGPVVTRLVLTTGGSIVDGNATGTDLKVNQLVLNAPTGVGSGANPVETAVVSLDFNNTTSGGVFIANSGALTLTDLDATAATAVGGAISASSPVTVSMSMTLTAATTFTAGNSAADNDDLTIDSGAVITLSGASAFALTLNAGDDIVFNTGSITSTGAGTKTVNLNADLEGAGGGDTDRGGVTQTGTTTSVTAGVLNISAPEAIGSSGTPFRFSATTLSTNTSGLTGNQFLFATTATSVSNLNAGSGAATPASGTINLVSGTFNLIVGDAIADTSAVVVSNPSVLNLNNDNETIGSLAGDGTVDLGQAVSYTFGINNDDGGRLRIDLNRDGILNALDDVILDDTQHGPLDKYSSTVSLGSGNYLFEYMYYERGGGDEGEAFYAPGTFSSFNSNFRLIGDASQGISIVGSITANTYKSGTLNSIAQADAIRLPGNLIGSATVGTVNFLGSGGGGNFGSDITPPGISGNVDDYVVYATGTLTSAGGAPGTLTVGGNNASTSFTGTIGTGDSGGLVKAGTGTMTLTNSNSYTGTTDVNAGTLSVTGTLAAGGGVVTVNSGGTLAGTGTVARTVSVASGGKLAPGTSGPGVLNTNNVTIASGATFAVDVNGGTVGTQYDQLNVTGTVNLTGSTLTAVGTITSTPGQQIVLINNDGTDAVTGTFNGLPEGSAVTINGVNFMLTYAGGTGNDVVLVDSATTSVQLSGGNLTVTDTLGGGTDDNLTIAKNGTFIRISDPTNNLYAGPGTTQIDLHTVDVPMASITGNTTFNTLGGNDTVTVDFAGGNPLPSGGFFFNGGTQTTSDKLVVTGGTTTTVTHNFTNANDGSIVLAGALAGTINYTGLEPITDNLSATDRIFNFNGGTESITLVDDIGATMTIDSSLSESVTFADPTNSITINAGTGDDTVAINSMDAAYHGILTFDGGANNDSLTLGAGLPSLSTLTITTESIGALPGLTIGAGGLSITSTSSDLTQTGAISVSGATVLNVGATHDITLTNAGNDFSSMSIVTGKNVSLTDANALILAASTVSGTLGVTTSGAITQSGILSVTGAATFAAGAANDITLANASNDFSSVGITTGKNVSLTDANALILAASTVSGTLGVTTSGTITQSGALSVTGAATFAAGAANDITLTTGSNDFSSVGITTGKNVSLTDANALILAASTVSGTLGVTTTGTITQSGALSVTGAATFAAGTANDITLNNASNDFSSVGITSSKNVLLVDLNALVLATSTVSGTLGVTTNGAITQSGPITVAGTSSFASGANNAITLSDPANDFTGAVSVTNSGTGAVSVRDANALVIGTFSVGTSTLTLTAGNGITQTGTITQAAAAGAVTLSGNAGTINLGLANNFTGAVTASTTGAGAAITIADNAGGLSAVSITTTDGAITLTGNNGTLAAGTVTAGNGGLITLTTTGGSGAITVDNVSTTGNVNITAVGTVNEPSADAGVDIAANVLTINAGASIGSSSSIEINATSLTASSTGTGGQIAVNDTAGGLVVTSATTTDGDITILAAGGDLTATLINAVTAGATARNIQLTTTSSGNVLVNSVTAAGHTITINSAGAIEESGADAGADLVADTISLSAATGIGAAGQVEVDVNTVTTASVSAVGAINLSDIAGGMTVTSATTVNGAITLNAVGGDLTLAAVSAGTGGLITLSTTTSGNILLGNVSTTGNASITSAGAVSENGADAGADISANNLTISAVNAIGLGGTIEIDATTLTANTTAANAFIDLADLAGGLTVTSATTSTSGAITLSAAGGNLVLTTVNSSGTGAAGNVTATTTGSGNIVVDNVFAVSDTLTLTAAGSILEAGAGDAGADLNAGILVLSAGTGIGATSGAGAIETAINNSLSGTTATGGVNLANTGVLTITGLTVTSSGDINFTNAGALTTSGVVSTGSGKITMSAASPITVGANMTATGDILLTAGEISDAPTWADDFTLNGGATIQSTAGNITLRAGDDIHLAAGTTVNAFGSVTLQAGFGDLDGAGSLDLQGTVISGGALNFSAPGDIVVGFLNAPGQIVTLTADSDNNGSGGIYRDGVAATNVIAGTLVASASTRIAAAPDAGAFGIHLVTQVSNLTATVANGAGDISIANSGGALSVTSATTSNGNITLSNAGGTLTVPTVTAGGTANISITTTGAGSNVLVGALSATGDTITVNSSGAIVDNNGAANNFAALNLSLTAVSGIGAADPLESTVTNLVATNTTGDIKLKNTGALTINGANVTGASGAITIDAASPITIAANESAPGAISHTAGEISDSPTFADDLTLNAGISITSTGASVTLLAGDDILTGAGSTISAATTVAITAASGDLDNHGAITLGGAISSGTGATLSARDAIALGGNVSATSGTISATSTAGSITHSAGTLTAPTVSLSAAAGSIGAAGAEVLTTTGTLTTASSGDQFVTESDGANVSGSSTAGSIHFTTTTGDWTIVAPGITAAVDVFMTATAGALLDSGAAGNTTIDITANHVTLQASTGIGQVGGNLDLDVSTVTSAISNTGGVRLDLQDSNNSGVTVTLVTATTSGNVNLTGTLGSAVRHIGAVTATSGNISVSAAAGDIDLTGNHTASGTITETATSGNITHAGGTLTAPTVTLSASGAIGASGADVLTSTNSLTTTSGGDQYITEANGLTAINLNAGANDIYLTLTAGAIADTDGAIDVVARGLVALAQGAIGTLANPIQTTIANLEANSQTGGVFLNETDALTIGGISIQTGVYAGGANIAINSGALTIAEDINTTFNVALNSTGTITETTGAVKNAALLAADSVGGQTLNGTNTVASFDADNFTSGNVSLQNAIGNLTIVKIANLVGAATVTNAGSVQLGDSSNQNINVSGIATITAAAGGAITDGNGATNNITGVAAILSAGAGIGTTANPIETNINNLEAAGGTGGVFVTEADALFIGGITAMNGVSATAGNIEIDSGNLSITEQISTPGTVDLDVIGSITEFGSGLVNAGVLNTNSTNGQTLNGPNTVNAFTAVNTGAGTGISLQNTANSFNIQAVTNQTGGTIFINNDGTDATISGVIKSGNPALGGDITIQTDGLLTVNATVDSSGGSGGTLTLGGLLTLNASPNVGLGDITLQGGTGPLTINAPITVASPLVLQSTEDVNILAKVETTSLTADITVLADLDNDGTGGVLISDNVFIGSLKAGRNLDVRGSEYQGSFDAGLANLDNGVIIDDNGSSPRLEATGNVFVKINNGGPATAQIWLGGLVRSNASGDVQFDSAILVTSDNAKALTHGAGDVIFFSTIDSGTGGPFNLRAATDVGVVLFNGEVGGVAPMDDVTVETASDVIVNGALTAGSFSVGNASGTVEIHGDLTTTDSGLNLSINAVSLVTTAAIDMTGGTGNGLLQVNNIDLGGDVSGDGVLTIQPRDTARSIGVNAAGDLNLDDTEIDRLQNGFQQIIIGRADGSGLITVGPRIAPDFWHDPVVFRSQAAGGQIQLTGQIYADDDGGFTFLAPTTIVNTPGVPSISAGTGDVNFGSLTYATAVTLLSNLDIETVGGDVLQVGTVNGDFALTIDAGTGAVNLNGSLSATPTGTSIGGITALDSISISGGALTLRPNVQTEGDQTYTGTTIQIFSGAYTATMAGNITFNGAMTLSNSVGVFTHGGDIDFNGTMDNVADPSTPAGKGALTVNAQTGAITFTGNVGTIEALKSVDINGASALTVNDDFSVFGSFKVKSDEVDLLGGINSVHVDGAVEFHPSSSNVQIEIGGSETATPNSLSLSDDDIAALADGATSVTISQPAPGQPITVVGPVTFHDPTSIFTNAKTGGNVTVDGDITADTADGGVTLKGLNVFLNADITTLGGGSIDISNGVIAGATILDTSAGDGNVTLRDKFLAIGAGHDLTISAGAGDINILTRLGAVAGVLGDVTLTSSGDTVIKTGGYMDSLTVDGGGTTFLGGRVQTSGVDGQDYVDAVILTSGVSLVSTHAAGVIHFEDTVNSEAGKLRNLAITNRAALAGTEVVTFDAGSDIGLALPLGASRLGTLNIQTRGDVTFGGDINAVSATVKAGNFVIQNVTVQKNLLLNGEGDFNGVLTADKLTIRSTGDIDNGGTAWVATTSATLYSLSGDITATGANVFGTLALAGNDATVEQAGNMNLGAVRLQGTLDVTTTAGGNLTQLSTQRVLAAKLEGTIAGSIALGHVRNTFTQIGDATVGLTAGGPIEIWSARPRATILDGTISTAVGDITLVADPNGKVGYFQTGPDLALDPAGRWVVFSSYDMVPFYNIDLEASLSPDTVIQNQNHPYVGVLPAGNVLIYKVQVGRQ